MYNSHKNKKSHKNYSQCSAIEESLNAINLKLNNAAAELDEIKNINIEILKFFAKELNAKNADELILRMSEFDKSQDFLDRIREFSASIDFASI
jgi:hypothetical protein